LKKLSVNGKSTEENNGVFERRHWAETEQPEKKKSGGVRK